MGAILNELNDIIREKDRVVATVATDLYNDLVEATPTGNPSLWKTTPLNPKRYRTRDGKRKLAKPVGYVGGYLKGGWELKETKDGWIIDNPVEYAEIRLLPLLLNGDGGVIQGSKQFPAGIEQIISKYERILQQKLKAIK